MATQQNPRIVGKLAAADLSSYQYCIMQLDSTEDEVTFCGANGIGYGILQNKPDAAGELAELAIDGDELIVVSTGVQRILRLRID